MNQKETWTEDVAFIIHSVSQEKHTVNQRQRMPRQDKQTLTVTLCRMRARAKIKAVI